MKPILETSSRLSRWHKRVIMAGGVLLALTGGLWIFPHYAIVAFPEIDGPEIRSVMHLLLIGHGVLGYAGAIILGTLLGRHIPAGLRRKKLPWSGITGLALVAGLIVTALFLYYAASPAIREAASLAHQVLGVLAIATIWRHVAVWGASSAKRARGRS